MAKAKMKKREKIMMAKGLSATLSYRQLSDKYIQ